MGSLLKRSLIFFGLMTAGLIFYTVRFNMNAENFDEAAVPYLNNAIPILASWQYSELEPLLSPQAREKLGTERGQAAYQLFTKLGRFKSMDKPQFQSDSYANTEGLGDIQIISYSIAADFESGPATVKMNLASTSDEIYYIHQFGIHSDVFAETQ